ncbi:MAG TPA: hypothetical protein VFF06_33445 [Polyangia bacterium]|nr:hypothetical protein [Polyangia bacterium]
MWLIVLALLPLDVTAPARPRSGAAPPTGLRLEVSAEGRRVAVRVVNGGPRRVKLWLGETCSGPHPFAAIVDGATRAFDLPVACAGEDRYEWLAAGGETRVVSMTELLPDDRPHRVSVRYHVSRLEHDLWRGDVEAPAVTLRASLLELSLRVLERPTAATRAMTVELRYTWHGDRTMRFFTGWEGACPQPQAEVLVDGAAHSSPDDRVCDGPVRPAAAELLPGGTRTESRRVLIDPARHEVRAVYAVDEKQALMIQRPDNVGVWIGTVESPSIVVEGAP